MRFEQMGYMRRHYVATDAATGKVIGYGAVEAGQESGRYRIFLVMSPDLLTGGMGNLMYDQLIADLSTLHARVVWTHEYAHDLTLLGFLSQHGFSETRRFPLPGSKTEAVLMERRLE
jgi:L-amino acid N-acyltransferase YncA